MALHDIVSAMTASSRVPVYIACALLLSGVALIPRVIRWLDMRKIPLVGKELGGYSKREKAYRENPLKLYEEGYEKYRDRAWRLTTADGR